jgi:hypothetical protein
MSLELRDLRWAIIASLHRSVRQAAEAAGAWDEGIVNSAALTWGPLHSLNTTTSVHSVMVDLARTARRHWTVAPTRPRNSPRLRPPQRRR